MPRWTRGRSRGVPEEADENEQADRPDDDQHDILPQTPCLHAAEVNAGRMNPAGGRVHETVDEPTIDQIVEHGNAPHCQAQPLMMGSITLRSKSATRRETNITGRMKMISYISSKYHLFQSKL